MRNWKTCLRIAAETASALDYLHSLESPTTIHGDVKYANILLDDNYTAKLAEFGSPMPICSHGQTSMIFTEIVRHLHPEYRGTGILRKKINYLFY